MTEKRNVEMTDLFRLKFVQGGQLSPDGNQVVYAVSHVNAEEEKEYVTLWLMSVDSGESWQLTAGTARDTSPQWSPDGRQIAFLSTRGEKPQVYVIPVDGGEARSLTNMKQGVGGGPVWSPDGKHIAFTAGPAREPRDPAKPYRVDRHVYRFDALEYLDDVVQSLYVISATGGEPRQVTHDRCMNAAPVWSPDGREILYLAAMLPDTHRAGSARLRVVNLIDGRVREVVGEWGGVISGNWLPDGSRIVFIGTPDGLPIGSKADLWVIDRNGGQPECRTAGLKNGVGGRMQPDMPLMTLTTSYPILITGDGKAAYVRVQNGGTLQIYRVALSGVESWEPVLTGDRACFPLGMSDRQLLYVVSGFNHPTDLYIADIEGGNERHLTQVNADVLAGLKLPNVERLLFPGSDGVEVEGWIVTPAEGKPPFPTILYIHGGPHSAFGNIYHFDTQMLTGAGYAVLLVNHRASTGYGDEFSTAIKGDWGNLDYKDLMAGVEYAIARGIADPDRLGVCGLSGGGNLSCWIVGNTNRFKAAVPENPVTNWVSFYGVSDIGVNFAVEELGGHPHEIPDIYRKCSPITYAHQCKTPTLMVQGEHDWRCPAEQSEQFYAVLKANGCHVEMLRLPNASHAGTIGGAPIMRRAHNEALLDWFNHFILGKERVKNIV